MKIKKDLYKLILKSFPQEICKENGGILGSENGIVTHYFHDEGLQVSNRCEYIPDTEKLNSIISDWSRFGVNFVGFVHNHPPIDAELSQADKSYITQIMQSCGMKDFYFPIVIPNKFMVVHRILYIDGRLTNEKESIELV